MSDIEIRCGNCNNVIPPENVDIDAAIVVCRRCGAIRRIVELMRLPVAGDSRYTYQREGDTLTVRKEATWDYLPMLLLGAGFCLLGFLLSAGGLFFMWEACAIGIGIMLFATWLSVDRRTIRITPEKCQITWTPFFIPFTREIPRRDVHKAVRQQTALRFLGRETVRLGYGDGFINLESVAANYDSTLLGAINHYLYTVPPADRTPRSDRIFLGGKESQTQEVKPYCPDCGHVILTENFDLASQRGTCDLCGREFSLAESPVMAYPDAAWPDSLRLKYEKEDGRLRIAWRQEWRLSEWVPEFLSQAIWLSILLWLFVLADKDPANAAGLTFFVILTIVMCLNTLWGLMVEWVIDFNAENLEISYKCLFFHGRQTMPRDKIAVFSLHEQKERWIKTLGRLCPQSAVIAERNDGHPSLQTPALRMPGFTHSLDVSQRHSDESVWLMNVLNDFLASKGVQKEAERIPRKSLFDPSWVPPSRKREG